MPLHDLFRLSKGCLAPWSSIGAMWVVCLARLTRKSLPKGRYLAHVSGYIGSVTEADIPVLVPGPEDRDPVLEFLPETVSFEPGLPDEFSVHVKDAEDDLRLVGAVEFVSPGNVNRPQERARFLAKCLGHLNAGVGLAVVDVVTTSPHNMHDELMALLNAPPQTMLRNAPTYVAGYRAVRDYDRLRVDVWPHSAPVGFTIPSVPLVLKNGPVVLLDLESTYAEAAAEHRLPPIPGVSDAQTH